MRRADFFARVRAAAAAGQAYRPRIDESPAAQVGYLGGGADCLGQLAEEIAAVGGQPQIVANLVQAGESLGRLLAAHGVRKALCWEHPVLEEMRLTALLAERGIEPLSYAGLSALGPEEQRRKILSADMGITSVSYAVAETGTLALGSAAGRERVASLAPPVHVAIVTADQVLPDLFDLFDRLSRDGALASNVALVTGPSKTGDIELRLTTGVHGPGVWHVLLCREACRANVPHRQDLGRSPDPC